MDFSRVGAVEADGAAYCARAQPTFGGKRRQIRGPYRPDQQAAQVDLDSMRAAARGMSREHGYAAMDVEADALKAGKPPKEVGYIDRDGNSFRAHTRMHTARDAHVPMCFYAVASSPIRLDIFLGPRCAIQCLIV